ncbi:MAG: hypothetical protein D6785_07650 [Planctomycetota bacterium]|nr:MAG: hypothetical protein D6785_07650 [Planctomycetota bacterium]
MQNGKTWLLLVIFCGAAIFGAVMNCSKSSTSSTSQKVSTKNSKNQILLISSGNKVDVKKFLVPGKYTVIEFYADW